MNCTANNTYKNAIIAIRTELEVIGGYYEDGPVGHNDYLIQLEDAKPVFTNVKFKHWSAGSNGIGVFRLRDSDLRVENSRFDLSYVVLNGSSQIVNYNNSLIVVNLNNNSQKVVLRNNFIFAGDRPMNNIFLNSTGTNNKYIVMVDGLEWERNGGTITGSDAIGRARGGLGVSYAFGGMNTAFGWIRNFYQQVSGGAPVSLSWAYQALTLSSGDLTNYTRHRGDERFVLSINMTATSITLSNILAGHRPGQIMSIYNAGANSFTVPTGGLLSITGGDRTVASNTFFLAEWTGSIWRSLN